MPKVDKKVLIFISGILWIAVGVFLLQLAYHWLTELTSKEAIIDLIIGLLSGIIIAYFGFSKLAGKNIARISKYEGKVCIWAFQKWTSYILIAFMMSLGIFLRHSPYIPKFILSPIYIGFGFALFTSGFRYFVFLLNSSKLS